MKTELKAKFLQHILNKKKDESGFTLIELLVVIIIIGILSAIALPSFLNQANKAKQSEAKTYVGSLNKGQQAYFTEKSVFGSAVDILGIGINTATVNYTYTTVDTNGTRADSTGESTVAVLRDYSGAVTIVQAGPTSDATSVAILCETDTPGAVAIAPTSGTACAGGSTQVGT
ncbi:type IV pilin-like G/H family protein [Nodularia chucula]|uniref:type IV pilin-like G/H family protein n=1 Tax=Nodularia chucula TaxID=3093667 RepID=UPI0039C6EFCA